MTHAGRNLRGQFPLLVGAAIVLLVGLLNAGGLFADWENRALDELQRQDAGRLAPDDRVVMVAITTDGMRQFQDWGVFWPWPRDLFARLVEVAAERGARAVVFDVLMDAPGIDQLSSSGPATDRAFAERLGGDPPVVLAAQLVPELDTDTPVPATLLHDGPPLPAYDLRGYDLLTPYTEFHTATLALANATADRDGVIRRLPILWRDDDSLMPGLALRAASYLPDWDPTAIPFQPDGEVLLRFYGPGGPDGPFPYLRAFDVITGAVDLDLDGKILLVGAYAAGLLEYKTSPMTSGTRPFPGFELHATLLSNLLRGHAIAVPSRATNAGFVVLAGLLTLGAIAAAGRRGLVRLTAAGLAMAIYLVAVVLAFRTGTLLPVVSAITASVLGVGAHFYMDWRLEGRQRQELRGVFSRYLHTSVIDELVKNPGSAHLDGTERRVTVMFADAVGFTSASEKLPPADVVAMLNSYFRDFVDVVLAHKGFLDKFIGDAVMTVFGVPETTPETQRLAASAVIEVQAALRAKNAERAARGAPTMAMNIGVHTDTAIIGNIGHPQRMDYTAIGSGVNTASRIEGANRQLGTRNLVSADFCADIPNSFRRREIGRLVLKGQSKPLQLFELIEAAEVGPWVDRWELAWSEWRAGRRETALEHWRAIARERPDDRAMPIFLQHREAALASEGDDDDVLVLASK